jgi:hypothetical protein
MAVNLLDFRASAPNTNNFPGAQVTVDNSFTTLANVGVFLPAVSPNRVEVVATAQLNATGSRQVGFRILRDGVTIYNSVQGVQSFEGSYTVTMEAVDFNAPAGFHVYTFQAVVLNAGLTVTASTRTLSALALGPV